jgi:hypothetical protein
MMKLYGLGPTRTLRALWALRELDSEFEYVPVNLLAGGARTAASLRVRHGKLSVTDGPFAETKEILGGFFLIDARDLNEAIQVASKWPSARLGTIEVRPVEEELGLDGRYT